jgi:hypothetical protein
MPDFELQDVEDCFTYYVQILEVPEDVFWHCDYAFVMSVVANKVAYDGWLSYVINREK